MNWGECLCMQQGLRQQQTKVKKKERKLCDYIVLSYLGCHHFIWRHHQKWRKKINGIRERWTMKSALSMVYQNIIVIVWNVSPSHQLPTSGWIFGIVFMPVLFILTRLKSLPLSNWQVYNNSSFIAIISIIAEYGFRLIHFIYIFILVSERRVSIFNTIEKASSNLSQWLFRNVRYPKCRNKSIVSVCVAW